MRTISIVESERTGFDYELRIHVRENHRNCIDFTEGELIGLKIMLEEKFPSEPCSLCDRARQLDCNYCMSCGNKVQ